MNKKMNSLNEVELNILALTAKLWEKILDLPELHPDDIHDYRRDIHNIQNRIAARVHWGADDKIDSDE